MNVSPRQRFLRKGFFRQPTYAITTPNERAVLNAVRRDQALTRAEIARQLALSGMSISRIVDGLVKRGFLAEGERKTGIRGPAVTVKLSKNAAYAFGLAVMSDAVSTCLVNFSGQVLASSFDTPTDMKRGTVLALASKRLAEFIRRAKIDSDRLFGVGLGLSGFFVGEGARFNAAPALDDWALVDLEDVLSEHFKLPAWADNDGNAAAVGESLIGTGRWARSFAYLYVATGFGGGLIFDGLSLRGANGNAGEFAGVLPPDYVHPNLDLLRRTLEKHGVVTASQADMLTRFSMEWPGVAEWLALTKPSFDLIISAAASILDPDAIVLGGRIPRPLAEAVASRVEIFNTYRRDHPRPTPKVVAAQSPGDATAVGAALMPLREHFFS